MKIKTLRLKNFKRFSDLTLRDIPENAKLVLLVGSNGSGKSSVFDAFEMLSTQNGKAWKDSRLNFKKDKTNSESIIITTEHGEEGLIEQRWHRSNKLNVSSFFGRTSFRQVPRLTKRSLGSDFDIIKDSDRAISFIDRDLRFENDLEHIFGKLLKEFFRTTDDKSAIKEQVTVPINDAFERIFNKENGTKLELLEVIPPLEGQIAEINFKKGESEFHYNYLSAGEKEIFNVLINLVARKEYYQDTIYFIDEMDLHLNTKLQYNFLKEITENWIPDNCQLWTASHSLGFIDYANDSESGVVIDFDDLDFDKPQTLSPKPKDDFEVFEIAVGKSFIDRIVQGRKIIFSENTDTPFFNDVNLPNTFFFVANDKNDAFHKAKNYKHFCLIDRDYLSDDEIKTIKSVYPFFYTLPYYSFENLLFHPDNLEEHYAKKNKYFDKKNYTDQIITIKNNERDYLVAGIIHARNGYPFFKENENAKHLKDFKENYRAVIDLLRSDAFENFYKVFPAKDYGKDIPERQNLTAYELTRTNWFKTQIENTVK